MLRLSAKSLFCMCVLMASGLFACTVEDADTDVPVDEKGGSGGSGGTEVGGQAGEEVGGQGGEAVGGQGGEGVGGQGGEPQLSDLGGYCENGTDCYEGLVCLSYNTQYFFSGGPANGICTINCANSATACDVFANSVCVNVGNEGDDTSQWCVPTCTVGEDNSTKCLERFDFACTHDAENNIGVCLPVCADDADCGEGTVCDPKTTVCVPDGSQNTGDALYDVCDPANDSCAGKCLDLGNGDGFCSQRCVVGTTYACGGETVGACVLAPAGAEVSPSVGDEAFCTKLCTTADDCGADFFSCDPNGYCLPL